MAFHGRSNTTLSKLSLPEPQPEEITSQLDRLNHALEGVMKEIQLSSISRNPSRMSAFNSELYGDPVPYSEHSEDSFYQNYDSTIEKLLQALDRQQMMLEDFFSEENRKESQIANSYKLCKNCIKHLPSIKKEICKDFSQIKSKENEREKRIYSERISELNEIKAEYFDKKHELMVGIEKLNLKEKILEDKENSIRAQRLTLEKQKSEWEKSKGIETQVELIKPAEKPVHGRASSYSYFTPPSTPEKAKKEEESKEELLKKLQSELSDLQTSAGCETENIIKVESLKNQISKIRGELAMNFSNKASKMINSMMASMQKEVERDDKAKRFELIQAASKNLVLSIKNSPLVPVKPTVLPFKKELEDGDKKTNGSEKHRNGKKKFRNLLYEKEKELAAKEALLQQTWMRVPGAKELIENINLTFSVINNEKNALYRDREELDKEKQEWLKSKKINRVST